MRILVTGGAGYAGVVLCRQLLEQGHAVTILDNFLYGCDSILHLFAYSNFSVVRKDIREDLKESVRSVDLIFHLAGVSGFPGCKANPIAAREINVDGTRGLIKHLSAEQILVYASTTSLYGDREGVSTESSPLQAVSLYGRTKLEAEQLVMERKSSVALRLATIFGVSPKMRSDLLVNEFVWRAIHERVLVLFDSSAKRTFLHLQDAARAYALVLDHAETMMGNVYNVGSAELSVTKRQIADSIAAKTGCTIVDSTITDLDRRDFQLSFAKIEQLGFKALVGLDHGIVELLRYYSVCNPRCFYQVI